MSEYQKLVTAVHKLSADIELYAARELSIPSKSIQADIKLNIDGTISLIYEHFITDFYIDLVLKPHFNTDNTLSIIEAESCEVVGIDMFAFHTWLEVKIKFLLKEK
jgi:hypothetical protein